MLRLPPGVRVDLRSTANAPDDDLGLGRAAQAPAEEAQLRREARRAKRALVALLALTGFLYFWDLSTSGYANSFYAAAVEAGTKSWKAFLFGSIDSSNFITVDKPPGSLWVTELSGRIFGFNSWSMLAPEALAGVASVGLLYAGLKRRFGAKAVLLAGAVPAITPVAALLFRYNNPDALLVLTLGASAYTLVRAVENGGTRWVAATGALLGFAFLVKMLQAFTVVPAFYLTYAIAAPGNLRRRARDRSGRGPGVRRHFLPLGSGDVGFAERRLAGPALRGSPRRRCPSPCRSADLQRGLGHPGEGCPPRSGRSSRSGCFSAPLPSRLLTEASCLKTARCAGLRC